MKKKTPSQAVEDFRGLVIHVRGTPAILDYDLARVYGVTTRALNQAVKRNIERFPDAFMFSLEPQEVANLKSQFVISSCPAAKSEPTTKSRHGGRRSAVQAFTEHGAIMASMVLNTPQAVKMSVFVVRAFIAMRSMLLGQKELAQKLTDLERTLTARLDTHEHTILDIIKQIMLLLTPPPEPEPPPRTPIGFSPHGPLREGE